MDFSKFVLRDSKLQFHQGGTKVLEVLDLKLVGYKITFLGFLFIFVFLTIWNSDWYFRIRYLQVYDSLHVCLIHNFDLPGLDNNNK